MLNREDWITAADRLLAALEPYRSPEKARLTLPGRGARSGPDVDGLEAFARTFLLASFRIAATRGEGCEALIETCAAGLVAGARPDGEESWPRVRSRSQPQVEAAAIAIALHESRDWVWARLDEAGRDAVIGWLAGAVGAEIPDNNWVLFRALAQQFLASVGGPYEQAEIDADLDRIDDWYRGDGWFTDGDGRAFDHYNGFVLHTFPMLWARMAAATPGVDVAARIDRHRDRLREFLGGAVAMVGGDGAPMHYGRSLTYRMAIAAPFWAGALADATPLDPGQTRRTCSSILQYFADHGAPDERGLLTLGWQGEHLPTTQSYSGPGSPYWGSFGFLGLLLDADHPVWTAPEQPWPGATADTTVALPAPGFLLQSTAADGIVRLLNHGTDHRGPDPHYDALAYSTRTGPVLDDPTAADNAITLLGADGARSGRSGIAPTVVEPHRIASTWTASTGEATGDDAAGDTWRIECCSWVRGPVEVRCFRTTGDRSPARCTVSGYPVSDTAAPASLETPQADGTVVTRGDGLLSAVIPLAGPPAVAAELRSGATAFGPATATPSVEYGPEVLGAVVAVAVVLSGDESAVEELLEGIEVTVSGDRVEVDLGGGVTGSYDFAA